MKTIRRRTMELLEAGRPEDPPSLWVDAALILLIALNVLATILQSVPVFHVSIGDELEAFNALSVAIFTVEYLFRMWSCVDKDDPRFAHPVKGRLRYGTTGMALIDLFAIVPFYLAAFVSVDLRFLRILRLLRILKLSHYFAALDILLDVLRNERHAFGAALFLMTIAVLFASSGIYLAEHEAQPTAFGSIPSAMWWAVVTLTTVGYGDVSPVTGAGKFFGAAMTVVGVGMVALPTGILASGFAHEVRRRREAYQAEVGLAMEDGVIDAQEQEHLDQLRQHLGLSDVHDLVIPMPEAPASGKCPHCGEAL